VDEDRLKYLATAEALAESSGDLEGFVTHLEETGWEFRQTYQLDLEIHRLRSEIGRLKAELAACKRDNSKKLQPRKRQRGRNNG
jgi:hypothetical protein